MHRDSVGFSCALLVLFAFSGCAVAPSHAAWNAEEKVIQPAGGGDGPSGSLVVESVFLGTGDRGNEQRRPFFLYDEQGNYLTHHQNHSMSAVPLRAGRYVVVTSILNTNKRVQVVIREGQTTVVHLSDFKSAPEAQ